MDNYYEKINNLEKRIEMYEKIIDELKEAYKSILPDENQELHNYEEENNDKIYSKVGNFTMIDKKDVKNINDFTIKEQNMLNSYNKYRLYEKCVNFTKYINKGGSWYNNAKFFISFII
jgi:hypothetical protein